jgi:hypothetical protein
MENYNIEYVKYLSGIISEEAYYKSQMNAQQINEDIEDRKTVVEIIDQTMQKIMSMEIPYSAIASSSAADTCKAYYAASNRFNKSARNALEELKKDAMLAQGLNVNVDRRFSGVLSQTASELGKLADRAEENMREKYNLQICQSSDDLFVNHNKNMDDLSKVLYAAKRELEAATFVSKPKPVVGGGESPAKTQKQGFFSSLTKLF